MVKILVSKSNPIVHHVTIPCLESFLVSSSKGTVAMKVPGLVTLCTFLLPLGVIFYLPTCFDAFGILLPMCVSTLLEMGDYLPNSILHLCPPWDMIPYFQCDSVILISSFQCLLPLHEFDVLEGPLRVEACDFLNCKKFLFLPLVIGVKGH